MPIRWDCGNSATTLSPGSKKRVAVCVQYAQYMQSEGRCEGIVLVTVCMRGGEAPGGQLSVMQFGSDGFVCAMHQVSGIKHQDREQPSC